MNFTYENQGSYTYLVYDITNEKSVDTMTLGMLTNNNIDGLANTLFTQVDNKKFVKYNVSSKVSVSQFFNGPVNQKRLISVFSGIVKALISAEEYMIDPASVLLDTDYIFADVSTCETVLICLPVIMRDKAENPGDIFKRIVFSTQFDQTENCDYVAKLINYLNSGSVFSLVDFKRVLDEIQNTNNSPVAKQPEASSANKETIQPEEKMSTSINTPHIIETPAMQVAQAAQQCPVVKVTPQIKSLNRARSSIKEENSNAKNQISLMTLLTHFSKDNLELYRSQKKEKQAKPTVSKASNVSFAVPGMSSSQQKVKEKIDIDNAPAKTVTKSDDLPKLQTSFVPSVAATTFSANFGDTTVLNPSVAIGETTVLGTNEIVELNQPTLVRIKNNERIKVNKDIFTIGKEQSYVDYLINDNPAISRSHANILSEVNEYYIIDTNSTNHTYVDGQMIQSNAKIKLHDGSKIKLANEEFEFQMC